jgi:hypothetical protein
VKFLGITFVILLSQLLDKCGRTYDREIKNLALENREMLSGGMDADQLCRDATLFSGERSRPAFGHLDTGLSDPVQRMFQ